MTSVLASRPDYLQAIGGIDAEWATIEHAFFLIFQTMMGVDASRAHAVFSHLSNHRLRQDIVNSVARVVLAGKPELRQLRQLEKRLERIALKRNVMAHAVWGVRGKDVFILDQRRDWRPIQVPLEDLLELQRALRELYDEIIQLLKVLRAQIPQAVVTAVPAPSPSSASATPSSPAASPAASPAPGAAA